MTGVSHSALLASYGGEGLTATYLSQTTDNGNQSTFSFTSYGIGAAATDRRIVICVHWSELGASHRTVSSATIGGVSATIHLQLGHSGGETGFGVAILSAVVPSGTTATVTINFSGNLGVSRNYCSISGFRLTGLSGSSPHDTASDQNFGTADDLSATIDIPENGILIAAFTSSTNAAGDAVTWTGATEEYDASNSEVRISAAWAEEMNEETGRTIQAAVATQADAGNAFAATSWN